MKLTFRKIGGFYKDKDIPITIDLGTLEDTCEGLGIEFHEITETLKNRNYDFSIELLWQGYITACKDAYKKPKFTRSHAIIWNEHLSKEASQEFVKKMTDLLGKIGKTTTNKKKVTTE